MENYEFHPLSKIFPLMDQEGIRELGLDIKNNGQKEPIVLFEGKILDGRNRYLACKMYNIIPIYEELKEGIDPEKFVLSKNLYRRHLNTAQRCEIALRLLKIEKKKAKIRQLQTQFKKKNTKEIQNTVGGKVTTTEDNQKKGKSIEISAKKAQVSSTTLKKARKIKIVAQNNSKIKEKWERARKNELSIESIYREIKKKESKQDIKKTPPENRSKVIKLCKKCAKAEVRYCLYCNQKFIICRKLGNLPFKKVDAEACKGFEEP